MADEIRHFVLGVLKLPDPATSHPEIAALKGAYEDLAGMSEDEFSGAVSRLLTARGAVRAAAGTLESFTDSVRQNVLSALDDTLKEFDQHAVRDKDLPVLFEGLDRIAEELFSRGVKA
jgi:hypothetical protein